MRATSHDRNAKRAIPIRQGIGAASKARKEREGDKIRRIIDRNRPDLLVKQFNLMLWRRQRRQMDAGDWRHKIHQMPTTIAASVTDSYAYLHS